MKRFRVLSYNIHKGFTWRNSAFVLEGIRAAIRQVHPEFVFLQEVLGEHLGHSRRVESWPTEPQFEYMADRLWPHFAYGKNAVYDEGHHGNAILSKFPILEWENEDVSTSSFERRGLLHAVVRPSKNRPRLHLVCAHFGLREKDRYHQAERLCERVRRHVQPGEALILAGDFNDWGLRLSPIFKKELGLEEAYHARHRRHARTFPARMPFLRLDRIYFNGGELPMHVRLAKVLHGEPWTKLSDHAPLLADLEWTAR